MYDYRWESKVPKNIGQGLWRGVLGGINSIFSLCKYSIIKSVAGKAFAPIAVAVGAYEVIKGVSDVFKESKANAKLAGTLLACTLALRDPFQSQTVSLIGFSLGCQVVKSCLKTLMELGATDII